MKERGKLDWRFDIDFVTGVFDFLVLGVLECVKEFICRFFVGFIFFSAKNGNGTSDLVQRSAKIQVYHRFTESDKIIFIKACLKKHRFWHAAKKHVLDF